MKILFEPAVFLKMKLHETMTEEWLKQRIIEHPTCLGLGSLTVKDEERRQPGGGRLDLLLESDETQKRYEVELQLGSTDEAHIIRAIEYWDVERKRYPTLSHCAVIIAENITGRFLNVISLFNGSVPLIALQVKAVQVKDCTSLVFTRVLDEVILGYPDEEEEMQEQADREMWSEKVGNSMMGICDQLLGLVNSVCPGFNFNYTKYYIGLLSEEKTKNFITFKPTKKCIIMRIKVPYTEETADVLESGGFTCDPYEDRYKQFRLRIFSEQDFSGEKKRILETLIKKSHDG